MTITAADIKLLESERMSDTADGGGRRTSKVIPDGQPGNIFPKVSRLDSVYGRVNLRKVFGKVDTANVDTYAGAHLIVTDPPDNARISVCAFTTGSDFDLRSDARDRIESYVVYGPESRMQLYGRQPVGAKAVLVYQRKSEGMPEVGEVFALTQENTSGVVQATQYIRIASVTFEDRTFEDERGTYDYRVITLGITAPITFAFTGIETPVRISAAATRLAKVRTTSVADAARYFGVQPLSEAITSGALTLRVPSIYTPIVPTSERETALSLVPIASASAYTPTGATRAGFVNSVSTAAGYTYYFSGAVSPTSLTVTASGLTGAASDDGNGTFTWAASSTGGTIDYAAGTVTFTSSQFGVNPRADAAVQTSLPAHTRQLPVTLATRGALYTATLSPIPAPGSCIVDYRALGKWYRLRDEAGDGTLRGSEAAYGTATIDYTSGALVITLGALPDVGSSVLIAWGSPVHYQQVLTDADTTLTQEIQLTNVPLKVASDIVVTVNYGSFTSAGTRTIAASAGATTTDLTKPFEAKINRTTGLLTITHRTLPQPGQLVTVGYTSLTDTAASAVPSVQSRQFTINALDTAPFDSLELGQAITAGELTLSLPMEMLLKSTIGGRAASASFRGNVNLVDDGLGNLRTAAKQVLQRLGAGPVATVTEGVAVATIQYSTGSIQILSSGVAAVGDVWQATGFNLGYAYQFGWVSTNGIAVRFGAALDYASVDAGSRSATATASFKNSGATTTDSPRTESFAHAQFPLVADLAKTTGNPVVPGSVLFSLSSGQDYTPSTTFFDRGNGVLYTGLDYSSGSAAVAGTVDYASGRVTLTNWLSQASAGNITVRGLLTSRGEFTAEDAFFRTSGSPVRTGSFFVQVTSSDGTIITGTSNADGVIIGTDVLGTIQQSMGVVSLRFGRWMPVAGNTGADWYNAGRVDPNDATRVWKPVYVYPSTLRYSCVVTSSVALDTSILGLDPVRLPQDGRVPIYRPGDVAVVHNTQSSALPNPVTAGTTYSVGRTGLSDLWLVDATGARIDSTKYTVNLNAGTVTMATPLAGITNPLSAKHRIEDMMLLSDVRIDGQLTSSSALTHSYPTAGTYVSSALLFGDLAARVTFVFDQATWTGTWDNVLIGSPATAQYNDVLYPIAVLNGGSITERWRVAFTSTTAFQVIGENSGVIATGSTTTDCAPANPLTGAPYFVIAAAGWGTGWSIGNNLRFNTLAAGANFWLARTTLPGAALTADSTSIQFRGDVDA